MSNPYPEMAKQFMDLWQKQIATVISDKEFIRSMLEMFSNMQNPESYGKNQQTNSSTSHHADTANVQPDDVASLTFRLNQCEKRISALEAKCNSKKSTTRKTSTSTKRRSKKPRQ